MIRTAVWTRAEGWGCVVAGLVAVVAYAWLYLPTLPESGAGWGEDYALHLPNLLAGCYWSAKSGLAVPWFTPAQCGGVPYLGDLNVAYYSVPQWLSFVAGPLPAVRWTFVLFAALGAAGFFTLLAGRFAASRPAALAGAVLFLFSGFYTARMLIGHLTYHPFTLVPWVAWAVLTPTTSPRQVLLPAIMAGFAFAYMFHAGMVHGILPALLVIVIIVMVHGQLRGHRREPWLILATGIALALALGAQRLAAAAAFIAQFPRADYALPGFPGLLQALHAALVLLFWRPPYHPGALLVNVQWAPSDAEFAFSVGPAALLALLAGTCVLARRGALPGSKRIWTAIVLLGAVPILLNWYYEPWNAWLKTLPLFGSSSILLRWYAAYVPLAILFAALAIDRTASATWPRRAAALALGLATIAWNIVVDDTRTYERAYDAAPVQHAWLALASGSPVPAIERIAPRLDAHDLDRNDALTRAESQAGCYQPMFGYRLERMPVGALRPGPALQEVAPGVLNVKNPACYTYPAANACRPGEHFRVEDRGRAEIFLRYEPFAFAMPAWQSAASIVSAAAGIAAVLLLAFSALARPGRR